MSGVVGGADFVPELPLSEPFEIEGLDGVFRASEFTLDQWRRLQELDDSGERARAMALGIAMGLRTESGERVFDDRNSKHLDAIMGWPIRAAMEASNRILNFNTPDGVGDGGNGEDEGKGEGARS